MNQTKQGSQWCFGMSVHILVDAGVGPGAHSDVAEAGYSMESEGIEYRYRGGLGRVPTGSAERAKVDLAKLDEWQATIRRGRDTVKPATIVEEQIPCQTDPISY